MKPRHSRILLAIAFVVATASTGAAQSPALERVELTVTADNDLAAAAPSSEALADLRADAVADDGTVIDVLLLYTPAARAAAGGVAQIQAIASRIIVETNAVFGNSLINPRVRLVGVIELPYTEAVDIDLDLQNLRAGPARAIRDSSHADLVQLLVASADPTACGRSYQLAENEVADFEAYSVLKATPECLSEYLPTRLLGYNLGAGGAREDGPDSGVFDYSAGYKDPINGFRTVMADPCAGANCPVIPHFSNPLVLFNSKPTGTALANNARTINNTALTVANWRQAAGPPVVPASPVNVRAQISGSEVVFSWDVAQNATNYILQLGTTPGSANVFNGPVGNVTSTSLSLPLGRYYWRVIASSDAGPSAPSAESQFDIVSTCGVPTAPSALVASVFGGVVSLIWVAPALGVVTAYIVEVGSGPGLVDRYNVRTATAQPQISGQVPGGTYYIRVRAANSCGVSPASDEIVLSIGSEPQPPRDLMISVEGAVVRITWNMESSTQPVLGFIVEAGSASGLTNLAQFATTETSLIVGRPGPGVYYVRVRARGFNGLSAPSDEVILVVQ